MLISSRQSIQSVVAGWVALRGTELVLSAGLRRSCDRYLFRNMPHTLANRVPRAIAARA